MLQFRDFLYGRKRPGVRAVPPIQNHLHFPARVPGNVCHQAGGELDQVQFLLGDVSIQTTERYLGSKQKLRGAVNERLGIEPDENR